MKYPWWTTALMTEDELAVEIKYTLIDIAKLYAIGDTHCKQTMRQKKKLLRLLMQGNRYEYWKVWRKTSRWEISRIRKHNRIRKKMRLSGWFHTFKMNRLKKPYKQKRRGLP
ncbi:hypothetical protein NVP2275O_172 [Vibrio phage 2.275.O._10N.286.54.E11]|nr:hypothetical protein NVP2275O_172 [Vibrio phage 2.275.O._10N.286.54.E11]